MKWHDGLPQDWGDVERFPPTADVESRDADVVGRTAENGYLIRDRSKDDAVLAMFDPADLDDFI